ncbi:MAG: putative dienelactone hydrolase [Rickettsiaceae bacterium]|nr:putative dienelactone hydrolase [Rickettsiaceae bacterium]
MSHDGKYIAYIAPLEGVLNIWIAPSDKPSDAKAITQDKGRGIRAYYWAYDNEHILYMQDEKGDENFRIYSHNFNTNENKLLTPESGVRSSIYGTSHKFPQEIIVGLNERDKRFFDIFKINLATGAKELVLENNKFIGFDFDEDLNLRFGVVPTNDGGAEYFEFKDKAWKNFMTVPSDDTKTTHIIGFDKSGSNIYLQDSRDRNIAALKVMNLKTLETKILAEDDRADVHILTAHPTDNIIQAVSVNYEKPSVKIIDESIKDDIEYLSNLSNGTLIINSRTQDDQAWLVAYDSDTQPVKYYKYDRKNKKAEFLFTNREALEKSELAPMHPVIIKARDGLNLVSYLTVPINLKLDENFKASSPVPLVLYVHGGPWVRDGWGLNPVHQWLANRGYAVLSVNYRGSNGLGKDFLNAGNREWGKKMHDDLIDSVNWAIEKNIADPKKVAIMGGSYGGYATLVGLTLTPDVFACGVDIVGPSNILTLIKSVPPYWEPILNDFKKRVGPWDTAEEIEALNQVSPLNHAGKINKPLFIAQGAHDPRVKQAESDQIVKAMRDKNIPVIYTLYEDEGHGFARAESRLSHYALVEQFFAHILGGKMEPIGDDLIGANFILNDKAQVSNIEAEDIIKAAIK